MMASEHHGEARYDAKTAAGMSRTRRDGSSYSRDVDRVSGDAETWFCELVDGVVDTSVNGTHGDRGYDVVVMTPNGVRVRIDVVHLGILPNGQPRSRQGARLIVNRNSVKLLRSDLIVVVEGPPFAVVGAIHTTRFLALALEIDLGFGVKFAMSVDNLSRLRDVL
jgi:hypothetical protein